MFAAFQIPDHIRRHVRDAFAIYAHREDKSRYTSLRCDGVRLVSKEPGRRMAGARVWKDELQYYGDPEWFEASVMASVKEMNRADTLLPFRHALDVLLGTIEGEEQRIEALTKAMHSFAGPSYPKRLEPHIIEDCADGIFANVLRAYEIAEIVAGEGATPAQASMKIRDWPDSALNAMERMLELPEGEIKRRIGNIPQ